MQKAVGHLMREYLPRSQTFVYALLRHHRDFAPVVLAGRTANLAEFPFSPVVELDGDRLPAPKRAALALLGRARGLAGAYELRLAREVERRGCSLLHAHFGPTGYRHLGVVARLGLPLVTTFYGYDVGLLREDRRWRDRYDRLFAEGDAFVCEGPAMAATLVALGCPAEKVHVVKIGIDLAGLVFRPPRRSTPLELVQVGRLVPKKGVDVSIRALALMGERVGSCRLRVVGDGPERGALAALAAELGVADRVHFLGSVDYATYTQVIGGAHLGLQPSRTAPDGDTEGGAPTVLLEMQAAGIPVAGTRHADIPAVVAAPDELVEEDDAEGLAEAIVALAGLPEEQWAERCRRGRELVETEHDAAVTAAAMERLYAGLLG